MSDSGRIGCAVALPSLGPAGGCSRAARRSPHEGSLRVALEVLERFLKVRDQRRTLGLSQGHKHDRHGIIVSVNGCKSDSRGLFPQRPGDGAQRREPPRAKGVRMERLFAMRIIKVPPLVSTKGTGVLGSSS